jgi:hypothetical protein
MRPETLQTLQDLEAGSTNQTERQTRLDAVSEPVPASVPVAVVAPVSAEAYLPSPDLEINGETPEVSPVNDGPANPFFKPFEDFFYEVACDPYTGQIMTDPVITPDGYCYERASLMAYLAAHDNLTPQGVKIPRNSEQYLIPNAKLKRAIDTVVQARRKPLNNNELLNVYAVFLQEIAYDYASFTWITDPAVFGVRNTSNTEIRGGTLSIAARTAEKAAIERHNTQELEAVQPRGIEPKLRIPSDPSNMGGYLDAAMDIELPLPIAYVRLRMALNRLKDQIKDLDMKLFPRFQNYDFADFAKDYQHKSTIVAAEVEPVAIVRRVVDPEQRTWWWTLGHLHEAWWYWRGMTRHPFDCFVPYLIKAPITLTVGTLFTPISAVARILNPAQCDPDLEPAFAKKKAAIEITAFTGAMLAQIPCMLLPEVRNYFYYPASQLISVLTASPSVTAVIPVPVITYALYAAYALLLATLVTATVMYMYGVYIEPALAPDDAPAEPERPVSEALYVPQLPNAPTQAPYLLWRRERNAPVEPIHEPVPPKSPLISPA